MNSRIKKNFSAEDVKIARFAKALGHPARIAIIRHLASHETCYFNEISKELPLADSTVSQHLTELKKAGLVQGHFDPPRVQYSMNFENWKIARKFLKEFTKIKILKNEKD